MKREEPIAVCSRCGTSIRATASFCTNCGNPLPSSGQSHPKREEKKKPPLSTARPKRKRASRPPKARRSTKKAAPSSNPQTSLPISGTGAALTVVAVSALVCLVGWDLLSLPSRGINGLVAEISPNPIYTLCRGMPTRSSEMFFCSASVGILALALGPLLPAGLLFAFRTQLTRGLRLVLARLPEQSRFLAAPVIGTIIFMIGWAGIHYETSGKMGLVPHRFFPLFIGLFTFITASYNTQIQYRLISFFEIRDQYPRWLLFVAAAGIPFILSLALTFQHRVSQEALKEQFIVLVALVTGYLVLVPRSGDFLSGVQQMMGSRQQR